MRGRRLVPLLGVLALVLAGCNSVPSKYSETLALRKIKLEFITNHERLARSHEANGALNEARRDWQLILAVVPDKAAVLAVIARLDEAISKRVREYRQAADAAEKKSDYASAQLALLKSLALRPDDSAVIKRLKDLEGRRAYAALALTPRVSDVVESEVDVYTAPGTRSASDAAGNEAVSEAPLRARPLPSTENPDRLVRATSADQSNSFNQGVLHLSRKEYEAALESFQQARNVGEEPDQRLEKYIKETRRVLADRHYELGVLAFRSARYDQAVNEFEQALRYVPGHHKARFYHSSAKELQGN